MVGRENVYEVSHQKRHAFSGVARGRTVISYIAFIIERAALLCYNSYQVIVILIATVFVRRITLRKVLVYGWGIHGYNLTKKPLCATKAVFLYKNRPHCSLFREFKQFFYGFPQYLSYIHRKLKGRIILAFFKSGNGLPADTYHVCQFLLADSNNHAMLSYFTNELSHAIPPLDQRTLSQT